MADEEIHEGNAGSNPPQKKKKSSLGMILIVVVAAALAGGAGYYFYGKTVMQNGQNRAAQADDRRDSGRNDRRDDRGNDRRDSGRNDRRDERIEVGPIVSLEPFVMNVSGSSSKYVKVSIALEVRDEKVTEEVKKTTPAVRDAMLAVLGAKPPEAFMDATGREAMKKELFDAADRFLKRGDLQAVYITDIIMQ